MEKMSDSVRTGDLVLAQGTYVLIQDGASGQVEVVVGPHKVSLAETDKTVVYNPDTRRFVPTNSQTAISICPSATEGQYIVLTNPEEEGNGHPAKGKQPSSQLSVGNKINIPGPDSFALFPGQVAEVVDGHQLKSNQYLLTRVYNEEAARINLEKAIIKTVTENEGGKTSDSKSKNSKKPSVIKEGDLFTGNLIIIEGTDVSFYIPATGIEVVKDGGSYVRDAVTLERLEYCILLDQNGDKRYVKGPDVVFPKPTEEFVEIEETGSRKFKAIELNENMGLYVKVIADHKEGNREYKAGEELFITGKEQKIYFPRPEHAVIKYGNEMLHYSTAVTEGEGRYVLNKESGKIDLVKGPRMLLPDPRKEVIIRRVLGEKTVSLMYPNNKEAIKHNKDLEEEISCRGDATDFAPLDFSNTLRSKTRTMKAVASFSAIADEMQRSNTYSKPRTLTLDNKYEGAVTVNIWPGFAIQVVKKTGEREVVQGPKTVMLEYDETLESLGLSTGRPKSDRATFKTVYLQTKNNIVTDIITAKTKDLVEVTLTLSCRVNFTGEPEKWFNVGNYVKLLTQHVRSLIRNTVKKTTIEEFNANATDIIRDLILGKSDEKKGGREGRTFDENGMNIYDVEVLGVEIGDEDISDLLVQAQHDAVENNLIIRKKEQELEYVKKKEDYERQTLTAEAVTVKLRSDLKLERIEQEKEEEDARLESDLGRQDKLDAITTATRERTKKKEELVIAHEKDRSLIVINEVKEKVSAIQPKMIEAIVALGHLKNNEILARNIKAQGGGLDGIFQKGGIEGLREAVKGTPLEKHLANLFDQKLLESDSEEKDDKK